MGVKRSMVRIASMAFSEANLRNAYHKCLDPNVAIRGVRQRLAYGALTSLKHLGLLDTGARLYRHKQSSEGGSTRYGIYRMHGRLLGVYRLHPIKVDVNRPMTVNVLVPGFETSSISAGFFGVFRVAYYLKEIGYNVRMVLYDDYEYEVEVVKKKLQSFPGLENIFSDLEYVYIGDRKTPLLVSPNDTSLATVWYSAYLAQRISDLCNKKKFLYLIQDHETRFFPANSLSVLAERSYGFNYAAIVSTDSLQRYFLKYDIAGIASRAVETISFENACSATLLPKDKFLDIHSKKKKRQIVFYSRPMVPRNMFDLAALALSEAFTRGIFNPDEWECVGMGIGKASIDLVGNIKSRSLPRMNLQAYLNTVAGFDVCLSLMASPHPSLIPMDLAGSGAIVVTNTFETKTPEYLTGLSKNIIPAEPELEALIVALEEAKERCEDLEARYRAAQEMRYPRDWKDSLTDRHRDFIYRAIGRPPESQLKMSA